MTKQQVKCFFFGHHWTVHQYSNDHVTWEQYECPKCGKREFKEMWGSKTWGW